jgi:hypothetical protein
VPFPAQRPHDGAPLPGGRVLVEALVAQVPLNDSVSALRDGLPANLIYRDNEAFDR